MRYLRSGTQQRAKKKGASMHVTACCERLVPMSWTIAVLM
jgi:hypothetical protein